MQVRLRNNFKKMQENFGLGERLREARQRKGLNKSKLGALVGTSGTSINNIEKGETASPSAILLERIASELEVNLRWLLTGEGAMGKAGAGASRSYHVGSGNANVQGEGNKVTGTPSECEQQLALALARIEALEDKVRDRDNQIDFLKGLLQK